MGTRGLTAVYVDGQYRIAQYGQWDHYPNGQGVTALEFCRHHLSNAKGRAAFKQALEKVHFSRDENELNSSTTQVEETDWTAGSPTFGKKKKVPYSYAGRNLGAEILERVLKAPEDNVYLVNGIDFVADSLFCEWAYVVDLDKESFEVFKGFQTSPIGEKERFANFFRKKEHRQENQYYPVKLVRAYDLNHLPSQKVFLEELAPS